MALVFSASLVPAPVPLVGVGDGGEHHRSFRLLGGQGGDLGGGGGDGDDHVHTVGDGLVGQLLHHALVALAGAGLILDGDAVLGGDLAQPLLYGLGDLVQGGVILLLDDGDLVGLAAGRLGGVVGRAHDHSGAVGAGNDAAVAGAQGEGQGRGRGDGEELLDDVALFHGVFLHICILGGR